jgi:hypothetical protein
MMKEKIWPVQIGTREQNRNGSDVHQVSQPIWLRVGNCKNPGKIMDAIDLAAMIALGI